MNMMNNQLLPDSLSGNNVLKMLWLNWSLSFGSMAVLLLMSLLVPYIWLPVIAAAEALCLHHLRIPACQSTEDGAMTVPILKISTYALWISASVMMAIEILCTPFLVGRVIFIPMYNDEIPFITCLVVFPALALCSALWLLFRQRSRSSIGPVTAIRTMLPRETAYQARILLLLSILLGSVEAWYYFTHYINSDINAPDRFFFVFMPIGFYLLSLFFMGGRYTSLSVLVNAVKAISPTPLSTLVRYLIFSDNELLVRPNPFGLYDSPAEYVKDDSEPVNDKTVSENFRKMSDTDRFTLRYLYRTESMPPAPGMLHYAAILDAGLNRSEMAPEDGDRWVGLYEIRRLASEGKLSPVLASELVRIYAVTMAWKTYDASGRRRYPIRNYKPTFRFRDLGKWDVDYDDTSWLDIASFNEDKPFYRLRKLFRRKK